MHARVSQGESRITETETEREKGDDVVQLIPAVAHAKGIGASPKVDRVIDARELRGEGDRLVGRIRRERDWKSPGRIESAGGD